MEFNLKGFFATFKAMKNNKQWVVIGILAIIALLIRIFSSSAMRVEQYYSTGIYQHLSGFLRRMLGWLPFSLGDVLYGLILVWLVFKLLQGARALIKRRFFTRGFIRWVQLLLIGSFLIYILFNVLWGINYNRRGIAGQLDLKMEKYSLDDLKTLNSLLLEKTNANKTLILQQARPVLTSSEISEQSRQAYEVVNRNYPFLKYYPASIKSSLWGWLGNYLGFMGYYNPFTGEGQVNANIPKFLQPYTNCHEIAHQLGYAKENEANFVGYLAAASSNNESFRYSAYLELFLYANRNLYFTDSSAAMGYTRQVIPAVKEDLKEWRLFNLRHQNPIEPLIRWAYGKYLENNQQPSGMLSYDEVTGYLVAYYKKYGKL
jgi:hypothetical protein